MKSFNKTEIEEMKKLFLDESTQNLAQLETQFQRIEVNSKDKMALVEIYRIIHSFKGMVGTIGLENFEKFFHLYENLISLIQENKVILDKEIINLFYETLDYIDAANIKISKNEPIDNLFDNIIKKIIKLSTLSSENSKELEKKIRIRSLFEQYGIDELSQQQIDLTDESKSIFLITITLKNNIKLKIARVFVIIKNIANYGKIGKTFPSFLDIIEGNFQNKFSILFQTDSKPKELRKVILKSGEISSIDLEQISLQKTVTLLKKMGVNEQKVDLKRIEENAADINSVKVELKELDQLLEYFGELLIRSKQLEKKMADLNRSDINEIVFQMQNYMFNLQDIVLQIQMVPISIAFRIFPRMIRNLSAREGKRIEFIVNHHDVKVDRKILTDFSEILTHLVRNAVSHGIEPENKRISLNKEPIGKLKIDTTIENNVLRVELSDDGTGIDIDEVKVTAIEKKIISNEEAEKLTVNEIISLIFKPNFSTSKIVDEISGRGMGLNIVKQRIEKLGGSINLESINGEGSTFTIMLPISRSLIRALLVECSGETYSIPLEDIQNLFQISRNNIRRINNQDFVFLDTINQSVKLYFLSEIFNIKTNENNKQLDQLNIVHIKKGSKTFALVVDEFIKESEIVIKNFQYTDQDVKGISGAAILDDGSVSLIIDTFTVINEND